MTDLANAKIAEANAILNPELKGSDLSVLIDKIVAWVKSLELDSLSREGAHILLHFTIDVLIPRLIEMGPAYSDLILEKVVLPLLKKLDAVFHPTT